MISQAEIRQRIASQGRYPVDTERFEKLWSYYTEEHEKGWKGLSLAELCPGNYGKKERKARY